MKDQANKDYRQTLQDQALKFLQRHQAEHLSEQLLFSRTVNYLVRVLGAKQALAENAAGAAFGALRSEGERHFLDISASTCHTAMITDPDSGLTYPIPVAAIIKHLVKHPNRRHLHAVN